MAQVGTEPLDRRVVARVTGEDADAVAIGLQVLDDRPPGMAGAAGDEDLHVADETAARPVTRHAACSSATFVSTTLRAAFGLGSTNMAAIAAPTSATPISA